MKRKGSIQPKSNNRGFSLVEVLVCVAILAIFCIPLFRGFRISALNNNRAHHTQEATAYAQKTLESVKSMRLEVELAADEALEVADRLKACVEDTGRGDPTNPAQVWRTQNEAKRNEFADYKDKQEYDILFDVIHFRQEKVTIGGKSYTVEVDMDPLPYSERKTGGETAENETPSDDANVYAVSQVNDVDGMQFPLIDDELINKYDTAIQDTFLAQAEGLGKLDALGGDDPARLEKIYENLTKRVIVTVRSGSGANSIFVTCDVEYKFNNSGCNFSEIYNVYNGSFDLDCGEACKDSEPEHTKFSGWKKGGRIYLFAKAYRNNSTLVPYGTNSIAGNDIEIISYYTGNHPLDVFLVRGQYPEPDKSDNFSSVKINGAYYYSSIPVNDLSGEEEYREPGYGEVNFHTNIKGYLNNPLDEWAKEQTIGREEPRLRNYEVTVTLTETESGKRAAQITSTKRLM